MGYYDQDNMTTIATIMNRAINDCDIITKDTILHHH